MPRSHALWTSDNKILSPPPRNSFTVPKCQARREKPNIGHTYSGNSQVFACGPSTLHFSLIFYTMQLDGSQDGKRPPSNSTILSQELFWMDIPQTAPFSSSSFSLPPSLQPRISLLHTWEIPPPLDPTCSPLLRLRRSRYILSESICGKWRMDWILLTFWICIYLCAVVVFVERLSRRSEANVVSCLVWIQADCDLLGSCYISHCCNAMGCEPQGQFASSCVCVCLFHIVCTSFLCLSFSVPVFFFHTFTAMFALLSHFVSLSLCICVFVRALVEVDEKSSVWQGSHCGCCSVYTSFRLGLCVKPLVLHWPFKQQHTHTHRLAHSSAAFIFTSFTIVRICCKTRVKSQSDQGEGIKINQSCKTAYASLSRRPQSANESRCHLFESKRASTERLKTN